MGWASFESDPYRLVVKGRGQSRNADSAANTNHDPGLVRTGSRLLLSALFLTIFYAADISNSSWGTDNVPTLKYGPVVLSALAAGFYMIGAKGVPLGWSAKAVAGFFLFSLAGGSYSFLAHGSSLGETFVGRALCVIPFWPAYFAAFLPKERAYISKWAPRVVWGLVAVMVPVLVLWRLGYRPIKAPHIYHITSVYFTVAAGFALAWTRVLQRRLAVAGMALACALTIKLTGFGFAAILAFVLWRAETVWRPGESRSRVAYRRLLISQAAVGVVLVAAAFAAVQPESLPGGSTEVRLQTYGWRLAEFKESPIWGRMFTGSPIVTVGLLVIPSHSDLLDILAFGGLIGSALFYAPAMAAVGHGFRAMGTYLVRRDTLALYGTTAVLAYLWESAVNPILGDARFIPVYWMALGVMLAAYTTSAMSTSVMRGATSRPVRS